MHITVRYLTKITTLRRKADRKQRRSLRLLHIAGGNYSRLQKIVYTGEVECVPNSKSAEGGVKLVMHMAVLKS